MPLANQSIAINENEARPKDLRCEYVQNPVGIDEAAPRLSWKLEGHRRGLHQTRYRIVVAESKVNLEQETCLVWDSGIVESGESIQREYSGAPLSSRQRYYWKVKIWDEFGAPSVWSETSYWEMGLLSAEDWNAIWIEPAQNPVVEEPCLSLEEQLKIDSSLGRTSYSDLNPCPLLRREFTLRDHILEARIYATAHGLYALELNGKAVDNIEFTPEMTAYERYLMYQTYDVTELVHPGPNAIGAILADGWYAGRVGVTGDSCQYGNTLALLLQLEVRYSDGTSEIIASDQGFLSSFGPFIYSDIFIGERYDARLKKTDWSSPGYDTQEWLPVKPIDVSLGNLVAQYGEPVRATETVEPTRIIITPKGETVIDLGQVIAGRIRMRVSGPEGIEVTLKHSEVLGQDGNFLMNIMGRNKEQTDHYILSGLGEETYEPKFTFHGFRYVKVIGYPGEVRPECFLGVVLRSDLSVSGSFECSEPRLNRLQANINWSQKGNMLSIPTDCPQRERAGWTGDIQVFAPTACFNMDVGAFLTRWLRNLRVDQLPDGQVPMVVPYLKGYRNKPASMGGDSSAGWGDAVVIVPWTLYRIYGDLKVLEENWAAMVQWMRYVERVATEEIPENLKGSLTPELRERQRFLWNTGFHFGDWLTPSVSIDFQTGNVDMMKSAFATMDMVPSFFYAYSTELMANIARILKKDEEAAYYTDLNWKVRNAFSDEYFDSLGQLRTKLQGICVLALKSKVVPAEYRDAVLKQLLKLIEENGYCLDTGFLSVPFLLDVLCENGYRETALRLLYQDRCPSWLYEVDMGATTIWEAWQAILPNGKVSNVSYNHYAFGCVGDWIYRELGGIAPGTPGYKRIIVAPRPDGHLSWAKTSLQTQYGNVTVEWCLSGSVMTLRSIIPPNTDAHIVLPGADLNSVKEIRGDHSNPRGLLQFRQEKKDVAVDVESGEYLFSYEYHQ